MIKQTAILSALFVSTQVSASTPCPTCPKGYVTSSLEEVLVMQKQKAHEQSIKKIIQSAPQSFVKAKKDSPKTPAQIVAKFTDLIKPIDKQPNRVLSQEEKSAIQQTASKTLEIKARDELIKGPSMLNRNKYSH